MSVPSESAPLLGRSTSLDSASASSALQPIRRTNNSNTQQDAQAEEARRTRAEIYAADEAMARRLQHELDPSFDEEQPQGHTHTHTHAQSRWTLFSPSSPTRTLPHSFHLLLICSPFCCSFFPLVRPGLARSASAPIAGAAVGGAAQRQQVREHMIGELLTQARLSGQGEREERRRGGREQREGRSDKADRLGSDWLCLSACLSVFRK